MKDKLTRKSRGVAFVLFLKKEDAFQCVKSMQGTMIGGRTVKVSLATDNGRTAEFIRRKDYPDKSRCFECGETGHLSYKCPKNVLGEREPPAKKSKKKATRKTTTTRPSAKKASLSEDSATESEVSTAEDDEPNEEERQLALNWSENWNTAIHADSSIVQQHSESRQGNEGSAKRYRQDSYFSDEEELCD